MVGGIGPHGSGNRSATQRVHEYQVYKSITESTSRGSSGSYKSNDTGTGCGVLLALAVIAGIASAISPVIEGFLFWGILLFLFLRFVFS